MQKIGDKMNTYINEKVPFACKYNPKGNYLLQIVRHGRKIRLKVFTGDTFKEQLDDFFSMYPVFKGEEKQIVQMIEVRTGIEYKIIAREAGVDKRESRLHNKMKSGKKRIIQLPLTIEAHYRHAPRLDVENKSFLTTPGIIRAVLTYYATLTPAEKLQVFDRGVESYRGFCEKSKDLSDFVVEEDIL